MTRPEKRLVNNEEIFSNFAKLERSVRCVACLGKEMAFAVGALDDAIKEYLLFRGFTQTLKLFEIERRDDRDKGFSFRVREEGGVAYEHNAHQLECTFHR